jgi:glycosyltransferase involved in cell wall biosynthesis
MRALVYNWVPFDVPGEGGGVSAYVREVLPALVRDHSWSITFLSSGYAYSVLNRICRYRRTRNALESIGIRSYEIVNSPIKAPAHDSFSLIEDCLSNETVASVFVDLMRETGPYDVVIFHGVEGLSTVTIERARAEGCAVILVAHNYHLVCPQIELLRDATDHCTTYHDGRDCVGCVGRLVDPHKAAAARALIAAMARFRIRGALAEMLFATALRGHQWLGDIRAGAAGIRRWQGAAPQFSGGHRHGWLVSRQKNDALIDDIARRVSGFRAWREINVNRINEHSDGVVAVSGTVKDQLVCRGVHPDKIEPIHLGLACHVDASERLRRFDARGRSTGPLRVGFFGYNIPSKGLPFLIQALEKAGELASRIDLTIVARHDDVLKRRLARLAGHFARVSWIDGYEQKELPQICDTIDLVVMPSIWHETFSITSYEIAMLGVPVLSSDSMGFSELVRDRRFVFRRNDAASLLGKLRHIVDNREMLRSYFVDHLEAPSAQAHVARFHDHVEMAVRVRSDAGCDQAGQAPASAGKAG